MCSQVIGWNKNELDEPASQQREALNCLSRMTGNFHVRFLEEEAAERLLTYSTAYSRNKANFGVLEGFLTVLLGEPIRIVEILESEGNQQRENDKFNRVDIKARNSKDEIIIVEVQNTREIYYLERILFGVAKAITEHIELGELYSQVKKVYSISILYFDIGKGNDYLYHGQNSFVGVHTGDFLEVTTKEKDAIVRKLPAEIFPEYFLIRVNEFNKVAVTPLEEWIEYLKTGIIRPDTKAPGLEETRRKLIYYNMDRAEQLAYDEHINAVMIQNDVLSTAAEEGREEGRQEGREEGRQEGREEGRQEGRQEGLAEGLEQGKQEKNIENARTMKALNISSEVIHQVTGLAYQRHRRIIKIARYYSFFVSPDFRFLRSRRDVLFFPA